MNFKQACVLAPLMPFTALLSAAFLGGCTAGQVAADYGAQNPDNKTAFACWFQDGTGTHMDDLTSKNQEYVITPTSYDTARVTGIFENNGGTIVVHGYYDGNPNHQQPLYRLGDHSVTELGLTLFPPYADPVARPDSLINYASSNQYLFRTAAYGALQAATGVYRGTPQCGWCPPGSSQGWSTQDWPGWLRQFGRSNNRGFPVGYAMKIPGIN